MYGTYALPLSHLRGGVNLYKVLLADDEIIDLEGLRTFIPWKDLDMEVVAAVNNGFAAASVLEREHVDILVTDIRMPNMSGLELAQKALENNAEMSVIFVSGHQDFHYLKQAMSMNACGYVLKPMDDKELIDSLVKARNGLEQKKKWRSHEAPSGTGAPMDQWNTKNGKLIAQVMAAVRDRLHENITLKQLAEQFCFSPNYLGALFKEETGQNFCDYVTKVRMEKAQELLRSTTLKIYEVAEQVGYRYFPYFSRQFKETCGMTPLEYRRRH